MPRARRFRFILLLVALGGLMLPATSLGAAKTKTLSYHGYRLAVPASWPVYRLSDDPTTCVRFNRHAVYLGTPSAQQRCPAHAAGRTEAILLQPVAVASSGAGSGGEALPIPSTAGAVAGYGSVARFVNRAHGIVVNATWGQHPAAIQLALGVRSLRAVAGRSRAAAARATVAVAPPVRAKAAQASVPGGVYTGLGFDPCSTPSSSQMSAWATSPYHAVGVYVGGTNVACSQSNLTTSWVSQESAGGWHLIPIYVGLQAPSNSCGCASISPGSAASQGTAAANDAIARSQAVGLGAGNPIYFDMEAYSTGGGSTSTVLTFLGAWTAQLHAAGYKSGVYSSADSGIKDLVSRYGTAYQEPDDIWVARWNGAKNTADPDVPAADFSAHQRLHQYDGGHNETHGGVTINIDGDYLDGATAAAGSGSPPVTVAAAPSLSVTPAADGGIDLSPSWTGAAGISSWQVVGGPSATLLAPITIPVSSGSRSPIVVHNAYPYFAVVALDSTGQTLGTSAPVPTPPHVAIFGNSAFVPPRGLAGLPVGCFAAGACKISTTISAGRTTLARTGSERVPAGGGLIYFKLSSSAEKTLSKARHHRLAVRISIRDAASGTTASRQLNLIPFRTTGSAPRRSVKQAATLKIVGTTEFVSAGHVGGVLAGCSASAPCHPVTTISVGRTVIAQTTPEFLGVGELGYLTFKLSGAGRTLLAHAHGNQLSAKLTLNDAGVVASAQIMVVSFS